MARISCSISRSRNALAVGEPWWANFCHDVRVIRFAAPWRLIADRVGVSCSADRQVLGKITKDGVYLEGTRAQPAQYLPAWSSRSAASGKNRSQPADEGYFGDAFKHPIRPGCRLTGTMIGRA